ncbi:MAG: hypothetical protein AVDCRST_MAG80-58 [uncultured Rubrobacteraceae bacterium]|uniref:Glycosyltransferase n=1 Tax=uncultured Rubrobacteraceae bacterium TaxID=349277 RepID=A0A6J4PQ66_9ACTN|nr:MAG: hypothetical protein AVDCRST_MAG80-58 [uncultured Rubrobacteraceae bacterium]
MTRLLIMAKAPVPGTTKTRLRLPPEKAASLQTALVRDTVEKAGLLGPLTVAGTPPESLHLIEPLLPKDVRLIAQSGEDLGERMFAAARRLFEEGSEPVLILGTDSPTLPLDSIWRARRVLEDKRQYDASIIGSTDGGYVLLGLAGLHEGLFLDIPWSTNAVYRKTVQRARALGLSIHEGEPHYDVDIPEDLVCLEKELGTNTRAAPHTAKFLREL